MTSAVDHAAKSNVWNQTDKWTGQFSIKWLYIKDVPNGNFRHIRLANNDNKPVTNSRDTQEVPNKQGREVLRIFAQYALRSSLLDDWEYYEQGVRPFASQWPPSLRLGGVTEGKAREEVRATSRQRAPR